MLIGIRENSVNTGACSSLSLFIYHVHDIEKGFHLMLHEYEHPEKKILILKLIHDFFLLTLKPVALIYFFQCYVDKKFPYLNYVLFLFIEKCYLWHRLGTLQF